MRAPIKGGFICVLWSRIVVAKPVQLSLQLHIRERKVQISGIATREKKQARGSLSGQMPIMPVCGMELMSTSGSKRSRAVTSSDNHNLLVLDHKN